MDLSLFLLQIVDSPRGKGVCIGGLVAQTPSILRTCVLSSGRVHTKAHAEAVDFVCDICHSIGEFGKVGPQGSIVVASIAPAVVQNNVVISRISQADLSHALCSAEQ